MFPCDKRSLVNPTSRRGATRESLSWACVGSTSESDKDAKTHGETDDSCFIFVLATVVVVDVMSSELPLPEKPFPPCPVLTTSYQNGRPYLAP